MLLKITDGSVRRGGEIVLSHFSFEIRGTEKIAIVGRNGAGKTTLLQVLTGEADLENNEKNPSSGISRARHYTVGMLRQQMKEDPYMTVEAFARACGEEVPFDRMFTQLGFTKEDKQKKLGELSGGQQVKVRLIGLLLSQPDVLILDEPTNHLDLAATQWLEKYIRAYPKAVVEVSHDRYFIDETADVIWEVSGGKVVLYTGNYTDYRREKALRYEKQLKDWERQQEQIRRLNALIEEFKHKPRKAAFARSRKTMLERMDRIPKPQADDAVIHTGDIIPERPGSKVVYECEHLQIGYEKGHPLQEVSLRLRRGMKLGVMGANGTGKSAFLKTVAGRLKPLKGKQQSGIHIDMAFLDQDIARLSSDKILIDWFHDQFPALTQKEVRTVLGGFLFHAQDLGKPVKSLSGGEKTRLALAAMFQRKPNFLILDEPTNNMDIPAKETLESIFRSYKGTILFVSHDRYFLSTVADSLLIFEAPEKKEKDGPGTVLYYPFGYRHYQEHRDKVGKDEDLAAIRTAQDQRMIEELKAVPKGETGMLRTISTQEAAFEWELGLAAQKMEKAAEAYEKALAAAREYDREQLKAFAQGAAEAPDPEIMNRVSAAQQAFTDACLEWYDVVIAYGRNNYSLQVL